MFKNLFFLIGIGFPNFSHATCFALAGDEFKIDWRVIYAIALVESNMNANAINFNKNRSVDIGLMQINSIHQHDLNKRGIAINDLFDPCKNVIAGAWILKRSIINADGDLWKGVGYYHSSTPALRKSYVNKVKREFEKINISD